MITEYRIVLKGRTLGKHLSHKQAMLQLRKEEAKHEGVPVLHTTSANSLRQLRKKAMGREGVPSRRVKRALRRLSSAQAGTPNKPGYNRPGSLNHW